MLVWLQLGVHYLGDVLGGLVIGVVLLGLYTSLCSHYDWQIRRKFPHEPGAAGSKYLVTEQFVLAEPLHIK